MKRLLKVLVIVIIAVVVVSCEVAMDADLPSSPPFGKDPKPTTPIKRRPIVPTTQLPRPRISEQYNTMSCVTQCEDEIASESIIAE